MIPFLTSTMWRAGLAVALVAAVALMGWTVSRWRNAYEALPALESALEAERLCEEGSECQARERALQEVVGREQIRVVTAYEAELAAVRGRQPVTVRVCDRGSLSIPGTAAGGDGSAAGAGALPGSAERDIGPALSALALEADEAVARCRALQRWNQALSSDNVR